MQRQRAVQQHAEKTQFTQSMYLTMTLAMLKAKQLQFDKQ